MNSKNTQLLWIALLLYSFSIFAQSDTDHINRHINFSDLPTRNSQTPDWATLFYTNPNAINIHKLKKEIDTWVKSEEAKKQGQKIIEKERKERKEKNKKEEHEELRESISEIPIVRFALNFMKRIPPHWIKSDGSIQIKKNNTQPTQQSANTLRTTNNSWTQIGPLEVVGFNDVQIPQHSNVYFIAVAPSDPNIWMASTETGALFKTTNNGEFWNFLGDYSGPIAFNPTDSNNCIIASNPIRESYDGGVTWEEKPVGVASNEVVWSPDGNTIMIAAYDGLWVSNDGGTTFTKRITNLYFYDVAFKPNSNTIAYAINAIGELYKTTDGGITWEMKTTDYPNTVSKDGFLLATSVSNPDLVAIASLTGENVELIKSLNSGDSFEPLSVLASGFSQGFYDFVFGISPTNSDIYYVGVTTLFKSIDGGLNYIAIGGYGGDYYLHPDIQDLEFDGNRVIVSTDGGVSVSSDNFTEYANWHSASRGLFDFELWGFDQGFNTDQMGGGKYHNGDHIYNTKWNNRKAIHLGGAESAVGFAVFSRPNSMYYGDIYSGFYMADEQYDANNYTNVVMSYPFSVNPSINPNSYSYGERTGDITSHVLYSNIVYMGYLNDLYMSEDNGITSNIIKSFDSQIWNVKTTRSNPNVIYVLTEYNGLWKTTDGGLNWTQKDFIFNGQNYNANGFQCYLDVSQTNENDVWIGYSDWNGNYAINNSFRIFKSNTSGQVWQSIDTNDLNGFTVREMRHQYGTDGGVYLIGYDIDGISKCYYRNNLMLNWIDYSNGLLKATVSGNRIYFRPSYYQGKIRAAGNRGVQEIPFYDEATVPVAQPTTNIKEICINQQIKLSDYSIVNYEGASWNWGFSKTPVYLNGTNANSQNPEIKFLTPGNVAVTLSVTNSNGTSNIKTIPNFIKVNYDTNSCLFSNTDHESFDVICNNNIPQSDGFYAGSSLDVTNFNGATNGRFAVKLSFKNNCYNTIGSLTALINLNNNTINVIQYNHFDNYPSTIIGNNTNNISSSSNYLAQIGFTLNNGTLQFNHIENGCGDTIELLESCWKPYDFLENGDSNETQNCNNTIPQSEAVEANTNVFVSNFDNATSGLFFVTINGNISCSNLSNKIKAIINLDNNTINVLDYNHFQSTTSSNVLANETAIVSSTLETNAQVVYSLINKKLYAKIINNSCFNDTFKINESCWSALDTNANGVDNVIEPSTCNNPIVTEQITDTDSHIVKDFNSIYSQQQNVFVKLNIQSDCNNTSATAYLSLDLTNGIIHVINYSHFGSNGSSTVNNNDSSNVYSESSINGQLKFSLYGKTLFIKRLSTTCPGSYYQILNTSCYSLATDEILAINNYTSSPNLEAIAYPNPTDGKISIKTKSEVKNYTLSFYTSDGKYITPKYATTNPNEIQVNLEGFANGWYFVILYDKNQNKNQFLKIIKK